MVAAKVIARHSAIPPLWQSLRTRWPCLVAEKMKSSGSTIIWERMMSEEEISSRRLESFAVARERARDLADDAVHLRALLPWPWGDEDHHPDVDHHDKQGYVEEETRGCKPGGQGMYARGTQSRLIFVDSKGRRDAGAWGACVPDVG